VQDLPSSERVTGGWRRLNHLSQIGILAIAVMLPSLQANAESCLLKTIPADTDKDELLEAYLDVAIDLNPCLSIGTTVEGCDSYIERHGSNYFVSLSGIELLTEDVLQSAAKQINLTNLEILRITGIQGYAVPKGTNHSMMALVFIDQREATQNPNAYFEAKLSWLNLGSTDTLTSVLSVFLSEQDEGCITLNHGDQKGNILISSTWIKSDLESTNINQCITRTFVGGMGLNADGMFASDEPANQSNVADDLFRLPINYKAFLKIHYSDLVKPGMTRDQIEGNEDILHALDCK
jgi:hypothetical protein